MVRPLTGAFVLFALAWGVPSQVMAQSAAADALFREAVQLAEKGDFASAAEKFKASYALEPARGALQGMAMAEEKQGRVATAYAHYRELVEASTRAGDTARAKVAQARVAALEPKLPRLVVDLAEDAPEGAELRLDGVLLAQAALGTPLPLDPGVHRIEGTSPSGSRASASATLVEGELTRVTLAWSAATRAPPEPATQGSSTVAPPREHALADDLGTPSSSQATIGFIVAGAGVLLGAAGAYFYVKSGDTFKEVEDQCPGNRCPDDLRERADEGKGQERLGQVGLITGGVALATGVTLVLLAPKGAPKRAGRVQLQLSPSSVTLGGTF